MKLMTTAPTYSAAAAVCVSGVLLQFFGWIVGANTMLEYLLAGR